MAASSRGLTPFGLVARARRDLDNPSFGSARLLPGKNSGGWRRRRAVVKCGCSDSIRRSSSADRCSEECRFDYKSSRPNYRSRIQPSSSLAFISPQSSFVSKQDKFFPRCTPRTTGPQSRDSPPKRDTGIANEKDWGISLLHEDVNESGTNEDGSTWYQESGEDIGENGYRCRWTRMGGQSSDGSSEWKEMHRFKSIACRVIVYHLSVPVYNVFHLQVDAFNWICSSPCQWWEKSDWTGYKELGVKKSGSNAEEDSWWETWREVLHQDEWSNIASIERSAQKQAKSGSKNAGWYENWWEKYDAKGWAEKGAHKYGRLDEQSWWEKWGENYDGRGSVLKWGDSVQQLNLLPLILEVIGSSHESSHLHSNARTDKWAETELGTKWGDKWEEKFFAGIGSRQGETWHVSNSGHRWSRTWGEEHFGNGFLNKSSKVHKYGKSTTGESWDIVVDEETYYEAEPHYGWADVVGDSTQLLSIQPRERPPGVFPNIDFGSPSSSFPGPPPPGDDDQSPPSPLIE